MGNAVLVVGGPGDGQNGESLRARALQLHSLVYTICVSKGTIHISCHKTDTS